MTKNKKGISFKVSALFLGILLCLCALAVLVSCSDKPQKPAFTSSVTSEITIVRTSVPHSDPPDDGNNASTNKPQSTSDSCSTVFKTSLPNTTSVTSQASVITEAQTSVPVTKPIYSTSVTQTVSRLPTTALPVPPEIDPDKAKTYTVNTVSENVTIDAEHTADYMCAYEFGSDTLLYTTDMFKRIYPASTTKLVTALYALYVADPDDIFTVGDELNMVARDASVARIKKGQKISLEHLLYAMLLPSGNDAAYTVAANVGRIIAKDSSLSAEKAVELFMQGVNKYADYIGMTDTNFTCPDGYHNDNHYTTLHDMLVATEACCDNELIMRVASTPYIKVKISSGQSFSWTNTNYLLGLDSKPELKYEGTIGMKTGYTGKAGACLITVVQREGKKVALLYYGGDSKMERFDECADILDCLFEYFDSLQNNPETVLNAEFRAFKTALFSITINKGCKKLVFYSPPIYIPYFND